jgi:hypothetical protein
LADLAQVLAWFASRGYRLEQVADTQWYKIYAPDGRSALIKESSLVSLMAKDGDDAEFEKSVNWCRCRSNHG